MAPPPTSSVFFASANGEDERLRAESGSSHAERDLKDSPQPSFLAYHILPPVLAAVPPLSSRAQQPAVSPGACAASRHHPPLVRHLLDNSLPLPQSLTSCLAFSSPAENNPDAEGPSLSSLSSVADSSAGSRAETAGEGATEAPLHDSASKAKSLNAPGETRPTLRSGKSLAERSVSSSNASSPIPPESVASQAPSYAPLLQYASASRSPSLLIPPFFSSPAAPQRSSTALQSELASSALRCRAAELLQSRLLRALAAAVYRAVQPHATNLASIIEVHALAAATDLRAAASHEASDPAETLNARREFPAVFPSFSASAFPFASSGSAFGGEGFREPGREAPGGAIFRGSRGDVFDFLPVVVAAAGVDAGDHRLAVQLLTFECMRRSRLSWRRWRKQQRRLNAEGADTGDDACAEKPRRKRPERDETKGVFFFRAAVLRASECTSLAAAVQAIYQQLTSSSSLCAQSAKAPVALFASDAQRASRSPRRGGRGGETPGESQKRRESDSAPSLFSSVSQQLEDAFFPLLSSAVSHEDVSTAGAWSEGTGFSRTDASLESLLFSHLGAKGGGEGPAAPCRSGGKGDGAPFAAGTRDAGHEDLRDDEGSAIFGDGGLSAAKRFDGICEKLELWWSDLNFFPANGGAGTDAAEARAKRRQKARRGVDYLLEEGSLRRAKTRRQKQMKALWGNSDEELASEADETDEDCAPGERGRLTATGSSPGRQGSDAGSPAASSALSTAGQETEDPPAEAPTRLAVGSSIFRPFFGGPRLARASGENGSRDAAGSVHVSSAVLLVVLEETEAFSLPFLSSLLHLLSLLRTQCRLPFLVVTAASSSSSIRQLLCDSRATNNFAVEAATLLQPSLVQQQIVNLLLSSSVTLPFSLPLSSLLVLLQHLEENAAPSVLQLVQVFQLVVRQFYQAHPLAFLCRGYEDVLPLLQTEGDAEDESDGAATAEAQTAEAKTGAGRRWGRAAKSGELGEEPGTGRKKVGAKAAETATGATAHEDPKEKEAGREGEKTSGETLSHGATSGRAVCVSPLSEEESDRREDARRLQSRAKRLLKQWSRRTELLAFSSITDDHIRLLTQLLRNTAEVYVHLVASQQHSGFFLDRCCWQQEQLLQKGASLLGGAGPRVSPLSRRSRPEQEDEETEEEEERKRRRSGDAALTVAKHAREDLGTRLHEPLHAKPAASHLTESPNASTSTVSSLPSSFPSFLPGCRRSGGCVSRRAVLAQLRAWWGCRGLLVFSRIQEEFRERRNALERQRARRPRDADEEKLKREEREATMALICREILPQATLDLAERRVGVSLAFRLLLLLQQQLERQRRSERMEGTEDDFSFLLRSTTQDPPTSDALRASRKAKTAQDARRSAAPATSKKGRGREKPATQRDDSEDSDRDELSDEASDEDSGDKAEERECWWSGAGAEAESGNRTMIDELERLLGVHEENACVLRKTRPQQRIQEMARASRSVGEDLHRLLGTLYEDLAVAAPARVFHESANPGAASACEGGVADPSALSLPLKLFFQQGHRELCLLRLFLAARSSPDGVPETSGVHTADILHALDNLRLVIQELDEASLSLAAGPKRDSRLLTKQRRSSVSPFRETETEVAASSVCTAGRPGKAREAVSLLASPDAVPSLGSLQNSSGDEGEKAPSLCRLYMLKTRFLRTVEELLLLLLLPLPSWHPLGTELAVWGGSLAIEVAATGLALPHVERGERRPESQLVSAAQTVCSRLETIPQRETLEHLAIVNPFYLQQFEDSEDEEERRDEVGSSSRGGGLGAPAENSLLLEDVSVVYRLLGDAGKRVGMWDLFCAFCRETLNGRLSQEKATQTRNGSAVAEGGDDEAQRAGEKRLRSRETRRERKTQEKQFEFDVLSKMEEEGNARSQASQSLTCASGSSVALPPANLLQQLQFRFAVACETLDHQMGLLRLPSAGAFAAAAEQALVGGQDEGGDVFFAANDGDEEGPEEKEDAWGDGDSKSRLLESRGGPGRAKTKTGRRWPTRFARRNQEEEDSEDEVAKEVQDELRQMKELLHGVYANRTQFGTVYVRDTVREIEEEEPEEATQLEKKRRRRKQTTAKKKRTKMEDSS
ncbi:conserved hypothetical protein [Neospora caninum Liverpool]|uniref:Uncharacterized protein n=1 Tax=Neospora caninum (strain Liverpool) TaxID=572307 RepID=F0VLQ2_NEOCL|nr:conserved hypothetical protein [Neospora caninum Liverpool]CBZ54180.1 conserved hypothetical protein [Neospora caninum Liverpool]CEL68881.1 TPA: hypothetical protein BN1204_046120 [Neospora caninum Liverpool]|eukprot:XP_003884211.1 conserved hypothetical protein [Neospora caninum Liverpool]